MNKGYLNLIRYRMWIGGWNDNGSAIIPLRVSSKTATRSLFRSHQFVIEAQVEVETNR